MAYTKYRRSYKPRRRVSRRYLRKRKLMARIKKDIMKCNFPTKIKFLGLPEKKVMFLQETINLANVNGATGEEGDQIPDYKGPLSIILNPMNCDTSTLFKNIESPFQGDDGIIKAPNFDKFTVLGIYIKMTPNANQFSPDLSADKVLRPISCFYSINNVSSTDLAADSKDYDYATRGLKQKFSFNCNENFTFFLNKPQTMDIDSPVIYKPGTWWSLGEVTSTSRLIPAEDGEDPDVDPNPPKPVESFKNEDKVQMNCGRLFFWSETPGAKIIPYTMTLSYKIALKG